MGRICPERARRALGHKKVCPQIITFPPNHKDPTMKSSTQDRVKGHTKDLKGKVKEGTGKAFNNPDLQDEGRADQAEGNVQRKAGEVKKVFGK